MSDLTRRPGSSPASRKTREKRAYQLVVAGGASSAVAVVGVVLTILGVVGAGLPIIAIIVAVVCALLFRRTTS
jgi:hypothetical protein